MGDGTCLHVQAHRMSMSESRCLIGLIEAGDEGRPLTPLQLAAVIRLERSGKLSIEQFEGWDVFDSVGAVWS